MANLDKARDIHKGLGMKLAKRTGARCVLAKLSPSCSSKRPFFVHKGRRISLSTQNRVFFSYDQQPNVVLTSLNGQKTRPERHFVGARCLGGSSERYEVTRALSSKTVVHNK